MSQHDFTVDNSDGHTVRTDIQSALQALATLSAGATAPSTPYALMWWADTANSLLKQRNAANNAWVSICTLNVALQTALGYTAENTANKDTDTALAANSDTKYASQKAIKTYTDAQVAAAVVTANAYSDAVAQGLSIKASVKLATAAALPSNVYANGSSGVGATLTGVSTGVLTVDGVAVALNDRLLVKDESTAAKNGIYKCTVAGAVGVLYVLTRVTDMDQSAEFPGAFTFVEVGTENGASGWVNASATAPTVGSTSIAFTQFSGAGEITVTSPITKSGNALSTNVSATSRIMGRKTAGAGVIEECTLSEVLDFISSAAQGDILYRGASTWARLGAGTAGYVLTTGGAGANPSWAAAANVLVQSVTSEIVTSTTGATLVPNDDSMPQNNEGDQYLAPATYTPKNASNTLVITTTIYLATSAAGGHMVAALFQDSIASALACGAQYIGTANALLCIKFTHVMPAGTTSGIAFKVRAGLNNIGTTTFNGIGGSRYYGGVLASSVRIDEYSV